MPARRPYHAARPRRFRPYLAWLRPWEEVCIDQPHKGGGSRGRRPGYVPMQAANSSPPWLGGGRGRRHSIATTSRPPPQPPPPTRGEGVAAAHLQLNPASMTLIRRGAPDIGPDRTDNQFSAWRNGSLQKARCVRHANSVCWPEARSEQREAGA